ncbi:MAG TPA: hypothetical protein DCQ98_19060 [Planctomycetaceae bacterium]|nr:hypothetical protein [Planctomycetaceae bacterium]
MIRLRTMTGIAIFFLLLLPSAFVAPLRGQTETPPNGDATIAVVSPATSGVQETAAPTANPVSLRWKFRPGDRFEVTASQTARQSVPIGGMLFEIPLTIGFEASWTVDEVDADGVATVTQTLTRLTFTAKSPFLGEVKADTAGEKPAEDPHGLDGKLRSAVGLKTTFRASPDGRTTAFRQLDPLPEGLQADAALQVFEPKQLEDLIGRGVVLPDKEVAPGETWTNRYEMPFADVGRLVQDFTFTYGGSREEAGESLEKIDFRADLSLVPNAVGEGAATFALRDSKLTGSALFDAARGHLVSVSIRTSLTVASEFEGMVTDSKSSVEGSTTIRRTETP